MKKLITLTLLILSPATYANCIGMDSFKTCNDNNGNTYTIIALVN